VRSSGDEGDPIVNRDPTSPVARAFHDIAGRIRQMCPAEGTAR
jgi:hypothetical protein